MHMKNKIEKNKLIIILIILVVIALISLLILNKNINNVNNNSYEQAVLKKEETVKTLVLQDLSNKSEQERMEYYCAQFFKYIGNRDFESAYDLLYSEYKENYFPTLVSFKKYILDYFPTTISVRYDNIERLGDIYVLWIHITDVHKGTYGHNFDMNVVIREYAYNDVKMSFSRNSAVDGMEE